MLLPYLRQLLAQGQTHVAVTAEAREVLRKIYKGEITFGEQPSLPAKSADAREEGATMIPRPTTTTSQSQPLLNIPRPSPQGETAEDKLTSLRDLAQHWPAFRSLGSLREHLVFSAGSAQAELMLIGDTPGYHEEHKGEPFAGPAGDKLNAILKAMGLSREEVYLTNICKYRPALPGQTRNNRPARPEENQLSRPFILAEIEIVKPKVIIALGAAAAHALLENDLPFDELRSQWHQVADIPVRVSHHPSFLLLADKDALAEKRKIWEDMLVVMGRLSLPISKKQETFFLPKS